MAKVWELSQHGGTDLLMLLAIADFADDQGNAYPAVATLAEKCRMKPRNAQVILSALRDSGELDVRPNEGPKGTNLYRVTLASQGVQHSAPLQGNAPLHSTAPGGALQCAKGVQHSAPEPSMNHQEPPVVRAKRARRSTDGQTFKEWFEPIKAAGEKAIKPDDPVFTWMETVGLNREFLSIAWESFKAKQLTTDKKQKSWPQTFLNYLRSGWIRVWYRDTDGVWRLNTAGKQLAIEHGLDPEMQASKGHDWMVGAI